MKKQQKLKKRDVYLNKLIALKDKDTVKVLTGIRRCGKSSVLKLMVEHLLENGVSSEQILEVNFEASDFKNMSADEFYHYVKDRSLSGKRMYLFFDEIPRIGAWEDAVDAFRQELDCDIYIAGSNSNPVFSGYATYLSGQCVEIKMYPLSFCEFLDFYGLEAARDAFESYLWFGGMPGIEDTSLDEDKALVLLDGIYSTVVLRDILERERRKGLKQITDPVLLEKIILHLADNISDNISVNSIGKILVEEGLLEDGTRRGTPGTQTVQAYVNALLEAYFFDEVRRYDIKEKEYLKSSGKYYIADIGLRNLLLGFREEDKDMENVLENIVYFELKRRGYDVAVGKMDKAEVDFVATKEDDKLYVQVTQSMLSEEIQKKELAPLEKIRDNYEKIVLSIEPGEKGSYEGIKSLNLVEWLMGVL